MIVKDSLCWPSVERTLLTRIKELHLDLETAKPEHIPRLQGELAAYRWLMREAEPQGFSPPNSV